MKKLLSLALIVATLCTMLVVPAQAVSGGYFTDISDEATAIAAEQLRMLGIVEGVGGSAFNPNGVLTRAEFCKMAILAAGRGDEALAQATRVIFLDVPSTHWALGYINAAAAVSKDAPALVSGTGNGNFAPAREITLGEAVTILMRLLGYADADFVTGGSWWSGYVSTAKGLGLLESIGTEGNKVITRAEAARLFANLMTTNQKGGSAFIRTLASSVESDQLILSVNATAQDGTAGAISTQNATYKMANISSAPALFAGKRADIALDAAGRVICILPQKDSSSRTFAVGEAKATGIELSDGSFLNINSSTLVYTASGSDSYATAWLNLARGTIVTAYFGADGSIASLYISQPDTKNAVVIGLTGGISDLVAGESNYSVFRNGVPVSGYDACTYDVATYNSAARVVNLSNMSITGIYTAGYPNAETPTRVTIMGRSFNLLPAASNQMSQFKIGDKITLFLTPNVKTDQDGGFEFGQVAGVVSASTFTSDTIGVALFDAEDYSTVSISLMDGCVFSAPCSFSKERAKQLNGTLVTFSGSSNGGILLSSTSSSRVSGNLNVAARTLGSTALSSNVRVIERVGSSAPVEISYSDLPKMNIPASKILYTALSSAGTVDLIVLDDVTGDRYDYGVLRIKYLETVNVWVDIPDETDPNIIIGGYWKNVVSDKGYFHIDTPSGSSDNYARSAQVYDGQYGGIATSLFPALTDSNKTASSVVTLSELGVVSRSDFTPGEPDVVSVTVTVNGKTYPVSEDVVCYSTRTKTWFNSLQEARAYSNELTLYIDRPVEEGGKIRMVTVSN